MLRSRFWKLRNQFCRLSNVARMAQKACPQITVVTTCCHITQRSHVRQNGPSLPFPSDDNEPARTHGREVQQTPPNDARHQSAFSRIHSIPPSIPGLPLHLHFHKDSPSPSLPLLSLLQAEDTGHNKVGHLCKNEITERPWACVHAEVEN